MDQICLRLCIARLWLALGAVCGAGAFTFPVTAQPYGVYQVDGPLTYNLNLAPTLISRDFFFDGQYPSLFAANMFHLSGGMSFIFNVENIRMDATSLDLTINGVTYNFFRDDSSYPAHASNVIEYRRRNDGRQDWIRSDQHDDGNYAWFIPVTVVFFPSTAFGSATASGGGGAPGASGFDPDEIDTSDFQFEIPGDGLEGEQGLLFTARGLQDHVTIWTPEGQDLPDDGSTITIEAPFLSPIENYFGVSLGFSGIHINRELFAWPLTIIHFAFYAVIHVWGLTSVVREFKR